MEGAIRVLNKLKEESVIEDYALGGAMALLFYAEPAVTYDLDVFIFLPKSEHRESGFISLSNLYAALEKMGYKPKKEHILIEGIPVQFLLAEELESEAIKKAINKDYSGVPVRVLSLEYLMAIMIKVGRPKDRERIAKLFEEKVPYNSEVFLDILGRFSLKEKWENNFAKFH